MMMLYYKVISHYKKQVTREYHFYVSFPVPVHKSQFIVVQADGRITVVPPYMWDGASGPTIDDRATVKPALEHDVLYQLIRTNVLSPGDRKHADKHLRQRLAQEMCVAIDKKYRGSGQSKLVAIPRSIEKTGATIRSWYWYAGTRVFGGLWNSTAVIDKEIGV